MSSPEFKNWFTLGNVLQILILLITVTIAWKSIDMQVQATILVTQDHESRIRTIEGEIARSLTGIDARLRNIEKVVAGGDY